MALGIHWSACRPICFAPKAYSLSFANPEIFPTQWVSPFAVSFSKLSRPIDFCAGASGTVHFISNWLQVQWMRVNAKLNPANVIYLQSLWNWAFQQLPSKPMGIDPFSIRECKDPVGKGFRSVGALLSNSGTSPHPVAVKVGILASIVPKPFFKSTSKISSTHLPMVPRTCHTVKGR